MMFGQSFDYWWEVLAHFFTGPDGVIVLSSAILLAFVIVLALFLRQRMPLRRPIAHAVSLISGYETQEQMVQRFESLDQTMLANEIMSHSWSEFTECLIFPREDDSPRIIRNTVNPDEYFAVETLIASRLNLRFYNAVPNMLTGAGILGTFVGLAFGIGLAQGSITSTNQSTMLKALSDLLGGASLAFWTSIVGLSLSLLFNLIEKKSVHGLQKLIDEWNRRLDSVLERTTEERLANEILAESKRQRVQLERFNTDLAVSIATALDEKFSQRLQPTLESLIQAMEQLREEKVHQSEAFLKNLASDFKNSLTDATKSEMVELSSTLTELSTNIKATVADLSNAGSGAGEILVRASESFANDIRSVLNESMETLNNQQRLTDSAFSTAMDKMTEHLDQIADLVDEASRHLDTELQGSAQRAGQILSDSAGHVGNELRLAAGQIASILKGSEAQLEQVKESLTALSDFNQASRESLRQLNESIDAIRSVHEAIRSSITPLVSASGKLSDVGERLDSSLEHIERLTEQLGNSSTAINEVSEVLTKSWANIESRYIHVDESLGRIFDQFQISVDQYTDKIRDFVTELDNSFSKATGHLSGAIQELSEALEERVELRNPQDLRRADDTE